jgi:hypothetical protein
MTSCCCLTLSGLKRPDDGICLATTAAVCFDGGDEVGCSAVVEKECTLPDAPQRRRAELIRTRTARVMPSARPLPMWWRRRSENRFAVWLERAALGVVELPQQPPPSRQEELLTEIRDVLKSQPRSVAAAQPFARISRPRSRSHDRLRSVSRLSCSFLPRASASSSLARPFSLK